MKCKPKARKVRGLGGHFAQTKQGSNEEISALLVQYIKTINEFD
jgi:hypothetical protein